jgi:hypothetical protein
MKGYPAERAVECGQFMAAAKWRAFMVAVGSLVASRRDDLPPALQLRLDEMNSQWTSGTVGEEFLLNVKLECWAFLTEKHGNSAAIVDREDRTVRAMLCLLESAGDEVEASDNADWLADMLGPEPFPKPNI